MCDPGSRGEFVVTDKCDTIADGLASLHPVEANVTAIREMVDEVRLVSESELLDAIRILLLDEHVVAEGAAPRPRPRSFRIHPPTPMPRLCFWSRERISLRKFFVGRSPEILRDFLSL